MNKIGKLLAIGAITLQLNAAAPSCLSVWVRSATYHSEARTSGVINGSEVKLEAFNGGTWTPRDCLIQLITKDIAGVESMQASQWFRNVYAQGNAKLTFNSPLCGSGYSSVTLRIYVFESGSMIQTDFDQITIRVP